MVQKTKHIFLLLIIIITIIIVLVIVLVLNVNRKGIDNCRCLQSNVNVDKATKKILNQGNAKNVSIIGEVVFLYVLKIPLLMKSNTLVNKFPILSWVIPN